jgi:ABC-type sugar transport system ATPase subunit
VEPQLIVMENPTVGVDVKAQAELHSLIRRKTKKGISVLLVSTDYREVSLVADRILIIREGEFGEELTESPFSKSAILHLVSRDTKKKRGGL